MSFNSALRAGLVVVLPWLFSLVIVGVARADLGVPFASADAASALAPLDQSVNPTGSVQPTAHESYLARVSIVLGHTSFYGDAGAVWWDFPPATRRIAAGTAPSELIPCDSACGAHVDWFETPTAPVTFAGSITSGPYGSSNIGFIVPLAGHYHADVSLTAGSVIFYGPGACPNFTPIPALATGTISLGHLDAGANNFCILAPNNSGASWTAHLARDAVRVAQASPDLAVIRSGTATVVSFSASDSDSVDETVVDSTGATVRTLGHSVPISEGQNRVVWDGRSDTGKRVEDGAYRVIITRPGDQASQTSTTVTVDTTPPTLALARTKLGSTKAALRIRAFDALSGLKSMIVFVRGKKTTITQVARAGVLFRPLGGWKRGATRLRIVAADVAGNTSVLIRIVTTPRRTLVTAHNG